MSGDDFTLDGALSALAGTVSTEADDDARWAKRVASRISTAAPMSRRELDPILVAPFPDDFVDEPGNFAQGAGASDDQNDHGDHAAVAADVGGSHGWEGSMSEDESRTSAPGSLAGLAGLTRSGPASGSGMEGHAKADDSGLIDLRAMNESQAAPADDGVIAIPSDLSKTSPEAPSSLSASKVAVASTASANAVPSSTTAATVSAGASSAAKPAEKKKGAGLWIGLGGLAAAAAIALVAVPMMSKKADEAPAASKQESPDKKKADEKVAQADKDKAAPAATAAASAEPAASAAEVASGAPDPAATVAAVPKMAAGGAPAPIAAKPTAGTPEPTKPGAKASAAPTVDPINKPSGGSLDDVLGIGKDAPTTKKADPTDGLPDKPDSLDVRSAINSKVGTASACVKGLDGPSSVSVTFGPTGTVSGVAVTSGPAKGTGAEACIKNAFSKAKVPASKKGASGNATLVP